MCRMDVDDTAPHFCFTTSPFKSHFVHLCGTKFARSVMLSKFLQTIPGSLSRLPPA